MRELRYFEQYGNAQKGLNRAILNSSFRKINIVRSIGHFVKFPPLLRLFISKTARIC
jgi:hypothetical protein